MEVVRHVTARCAGVNGSTATKIDGVDAKRYRARCDQEANVVWATMKRTFALQGNFVLGVAQDGARMGNPGDERVVYMAICKRQGVAGDLFNMAIILVVSHT